MHNVYNENIDVLAEKGAEDVLEPTTTQDCTSLDAGN